MKLLVTVVLLCLIAIHCKHKEFYIVEDQKFFFTRSTKKFNGLVKSVVETKVETDSVYNTNKVKKATYLDKYRFSREGILSYWISRYNNETDLELTNDGQGVEEVEFVAEKTFKKSIHNWSQDGPARVLTTKVYIDGELKETVVKKYDSSYKILIEEYESPNGKTSSFKFKYSGDTLVSVLNSSYTKTYSYAQNIDTVKTFDEYKQLVSTVIRYYNDNKDVEKISTLRPGKDLDITLFEYKYDSLKNWVFRKLTSKYSSSEVTSISRREIKYY